MRNTLRPRHSVAISELRYGKRDNTLTVEYRNGGRYIYAQVSNDLWKRVREMGKAEGYGKAVNALVKPNCDFMKVN
jgi:hypothetical protein